MRVCQTKLLILILDEIAPEYLHAIYGISIECIVVRHMDIPMSSKNVTNGTNEFKFYKAIQVNNSFFVVSTIMLTIIEITCHSAATQQITTCMYPSKLQQFHQLKEEIFDVKFKPVRLICLQEDLEKLIKDIDIVR